MAVFSLLWASLTFGTGFEDKPVFSLICTFLPLFCMNMTINAVFSCDEADKSNRFLRALPASAFQIVCARYLSVLGAGLLGLTMAFVASVLVGILGGHHLGIVLATGGTVTALLFSICSMLLFCTAALPVIYRYTIINTRLIWAIVAAILVIVFANLGANVTVSQRVSGMLSTLFETGFGIAIILLLVFGVFAASMWLSVRIFTEKEA